MKITIVVLGTIVTSAIGWWFFPSPERSAYDFFEMRYQEVAEDRYFDALTTLQCSPSQSHSIFTRKAAYLCRIDTPCETYVEQRVFVDRIFGARVWPDPFYQRFARACIEVLNVEATKQAAANIDQGG